ncbi:MAG: OadG family protein [Clostridium sp.]|nr:OadG family protein [Clostridium sp.]
MKQNIKRLLLLLSMITCFFVLSGCAKTEDAGSEEVTADIEETLMNGSRQYLATFAAYSDEELEEQIKQAEKAENTVISTALSSWKSVKEDLGKLQVDEMGAPLIQTDEETGEPAVTVQAEGEDTYQIEMTAVYEQRTMEFVLTAEAEDDGYGGSVLTVTEMTFTPDYSIGEKLQKAFLNMLMGMGTVFVVLLFISFIISRLKMVNSWGMKKEDKAVKENVPAPAPIKPAAPVPVPQPAPVKPAEPVSNTSEPAPAQSEEAGGENLADDLELVAVITAAISASQQIPAEGLIVRSIRRKSGSNWKRS